MRTPPTSSLLTTPAGPQERATKTSYRGAPRGQLTPPGPGTQEAGSCVLTDVERWNGILHLRTGRNQRPFLYADPIVRDRIRSANSLFPPVPLDGSIFRRDSPSLWGGSPAVLFHGTTGAGVPHRGRTDAYPPATRGDCDSGYRPSTRRGIGNNTQCRNVRSKCQCSMCLQFTLVLAASCVLHRPMSLVIHR